MVQIECESVHYSSSTFHQTRVLNPFDNTVESSVPLPRRLVHCQEQIQQLGFYLSFVIGNQVVARCNRTFMNWDPLFALIPFILYITISLSLYSSPIRDLYSILLPICLPTVFLYRINSKTPLFIGAYVSSNCVSFVFLPFQSTRSKVITAISNNTASTFSPPPPHKRKSLQNRQQ